MTQLQFNYEVTFGILLKNIAIQGVTLKQTHYIFVSPCSPRVPGPFIGS